MMNSLVYVVPSIFLLLAAGPPDAGADGPADRAEATVTETPSRVTLENDSVRLAFDVKTNCVPCELVDKQDSGQNLIVNNFCLYYQYVEGGAIRSVNEGYPGGRIAHQAGGSGWRPLHQRGRRVLLRRISAGAGQAAGVAA